GKHEIVPDEDAELVAQFVEPVGLVLAAAPDAQHVHIGGPGAFQQIPHHGGGGARWDGVRRDPVGTHHGDVTAVDAAFDGVVDLVLFYHPFEPPEADAARGNLAFEVGDQFVERLRPLPGRPPDVGVPDGEIVGEEVFAGVHDDLVGDDLAVDAVLDFHRTGG